MKMSGSLILVPILGVPFFLLFNFGKMFFVLLYLTLLCFVRSLFFFNERQKGS